MAVNSIQKTFLNLLRNIVPVADAGLIQPFKRIKQPQGVWPFRCKKTVPCPKVRQQTCGCEEDGNTEKSAIVYYIKNETAATVAPQTLTTG